MRLAHIVVLPLALVAASCGGQVEAVPGQEQPSSVDAGRVAAIDASAWQCLSFGRVPACPAGTADGTPCPVSLSGTMCVSDERATGLGEVYACIGAWERMPDRCGPLFGASSSACADACRRACQDGSVTCITTCEMACPP